MKKLLLMIVLAIGFATTLQAQYASTMKVRLADTILDGDRIDYCADTLIVYRPNAALSNIVWGVPNFGSSILNVDSVVITKKNNGRLTFSSNQIVMYVDIYLASSIPATGVMRDTSFCEAGFKPFFLYAPDPNCLSYQWYKGSSDKNWRTVVQTFDTFIVKQTNGCGPNWDTAVVYQHNSHPKLSLGSDVTTCDGNEVVLTPNYTDYVSYNWVKTGKTGVRDTVTTTNRYKLRTVDVIGCKDSAEKQVTMVFPDQQNLCAAAFDSISQKNKLFWWADPTSNASQIVIFTRDLSDNMSPIDTVSYGSSSWTDYNSIPQNQQYEYSIGVIDTCNNLSAIGTNHKTILLTIGQFSNALSFTWTKYMGTTVPNYTLYGVKANGTASVITTLPASYLGYNYNNFDTSYRHYYVGFSMPSCSHRSMINVRSNNVDYKTNGIAELNEDLYKVYPNPVNNKIFIQSPTTVTVKLMDITGKTLVTKQLQNGNIDVSEYPVGLYLVQLQAVNGGMLVRKIVKQ